MPGSVGEEEVEQRGRECAAKKGSEKTAKKLTVESKNEKTFQPQQPLDALADLLLAPFPPELRGKIRRSVANTARAFDDLLISLGGGGGQKALK